MNAFAIGDQADWCHACGNSTGVCAASSAPAIPVSGGKSGGGGVSKAVAGVIGAFVTLAVILGVEALVLLVAGLRVVSKKRLSGGNAGNGAVEAKASG